MPELLNEEGREDEGEPDQEAGQEGPASGLQSENSQRRGATSAAASFGPHEPFG